MSRAVRSRVLLGAGAFLVAAVAIGGWLAASPTDTDGDTAFTAPTEDEWSVIRSEVPRADAEAALAYANELRTTQPGVGSRLTTQHVEFYFPDDARVFVPLPRDRVAVSFAPFISRTHACTVHSISGCRGELSDQEFDVVVRSAEGKRVLDSTMRTADNGFFELWLPRGGEFEVMISMGDRVATRTITTSSEDPTCVTDMQLL